MPLKITEELLQFAIANNAGQEGIKRARNGECVAADRIWLAGTTNCPVEVLRELAEDSDGCVRWEVAGNNNCPVEVLGELAKDSEDYVRREVVANINCPVEVLRELAKDNARYVRRAATTRINKRSLK